MKVRLCPDCQEIVYYNSYFKSLYCGRCGWKEASAPRRLLLRPKNRVFKADDTVVLESSK